MLRRALRPLRSPVRMTPAQMAFGAQMRRLREVEIRMTQRMQEAERVIAKVANARGPQGIPGKKPTREELRALILPLIPTAIPGKDAVIDYEYIVDRVIAMIPPAPPGKNADPAEVVGLFAQHLKEGKIHIPQENVDGFAQTMQAFKHQLDNRGGYIHGGGDTVGAGVGIVITDVNGTKIISAVPGGSVGVADISSQFNGVLTTFTIPAYSSILQFTITGWPPEGVLRPTTDFTTPTTTTVTLQAPLTAPVAGTTGIILYVAA